MNINWQFSLFQCDFNLCWIKTSNINLVCIYYAMDQTKKCTRFVLAFVINGSQTQKCKYAILFLELMVYSTLHNFIGPYTICFYTFKMSYEIIDSKTYYNAKYLHQKYSWYRSNFIHGQFRNWKLCSWKCIEW